MAKLVDARSGSRLCLSANVASGGDRHSDAKDKVKHNTGSNPVRPTKINATLMNADSIIKN